MFRPRGIKGFFLSLEVFLFEPGGDPGRAQRRQGRRGHEGTHGTSSKCQGPRFGDGSLSFKQKREIPEAAIGGFPCEKIVLCPLLLLEGGCLFDKGAPDSSEAVVALGGLWRRLNS